MSTICVAVGRFGDAVADELDHIGEISDVWATDSLPDAEDLPPADRYLVVAWSPDHERMQALTTTAARWGAAVLPIIADRHEIVVGPLLGAGHGPCPQCVRARRDEHRRAAAHTHLQGVDGATPVDAGEAFLPPSARIAAHGAAALLVDPARGDFIAFGATAMSIRRGRMVGLADCPTCAGAPSTAARSLATSGARS